MVSESTYFHKIIHDLSPVYITAYINFASERIHSTGLSSQRYVKEPTCRTKIYQWSHFSYCIKIWNGLDPDIQDKDSYKELNSVFSAHDL